MKWRWIVKTASGNTYRIDHTGYWEDERDKAAGSGIMGMEKPVIGEPLFLLEPGQKTFRRTSRVVAIEEVLA